MPDPEADLLKVSADAPLAEIKKAFRKAAMAHHPDQNPHPEAAPHFRRLTEAYRALEAKALLREPPRPRREVPLEDRVSFLLADIRALVRRWPVERWTQNVDGLPAAVWVASVLEVLARRWPGAPEPVPIAPHPAGLLAALEGWPDRMAGWPLAHPLPPRQSRPLAEAVRAAEIRLRALDRPARKKAPAKPSSP